jgi:hypothetical protein
MKHVYHSTLLGALLLCNVFVYGQAPRLDPMHFPRPNLEFGQTVPGYIRPPMVRKIMPGHVRDIGIWNHTMDSVRVMAPDRMPCLVTDLSRMERMPVRRYRDPELKSMR